MSLPFMKELDEASSSKQIAAGGIVLITIGLMVVNVLGIWAGSDSESLSSAAIRVALSFAVAGAEALAAVALIRAMLAPNRLRMYTAFIITLAIAFVCVENGKRSVKVIFPDLFDESSELLDAKSKIAGVNAQKESAASQRMIDNQGSELTNVRSQIAELQVERRLMAASTEPKIREAQAVLKAAGKYTGRIDGKREELTETAMLARGEEISARLEVLRAMEDNLLRNGTLVDSSTSDDNTKSSAIIQAELDEKKRKAEAAVIWIERMLWVFEGARTLGSWAFVFGVTGATNSRKEQLENDILEAGLEQKLKDARRGLDDEPDVPSVPQPEAPRDAPASEVPPPNNPGAKLGGLSTGMNKTSDKQDNRITVPSGAST